MLGGSLFRFPIRHDKRKIAHSEITEDTMSADELGLNLKTWMKEMKEAMLFLNNVTELKLYTIEEKGRQMKTIFHYQSIRESTSTDRTLFKEAFSSFKPHEECKPCVVTYPLTLTEVNGGGQGKDTMEKWLIQQGVGDICNSGQVWQYVDTVKPRHGIAAPLSTTTKREDFKGQVFCFLPLPVQSGLPVHVNGHFILNSTRRELWTSTDISREDDRSKWNSNLVQALSSSYADFLHQARTHYVAEEYKNIRSALSCIEHYYSLFPNYSSQSKGVWNTLACDTYKVILERNLPIFCVLKSTPNGYSTEWYPPNSSSVADHVYYWNPSHYYSGKHKDAYPILERIGMKITPASNQIIGCFNVILKESQSLNTFSSVTRQSIFEYYTKHSTFSAGEMMPTAIEDTAFQDVTSFVLFTKYLLEKEHMQSSLLASTSLSYSSLIPANRVPSKCIYPNSPFMNYLLLTADGILRKFEKNAKALCSSFSQVFPNSLHCFLHPKLLDAHYISSYFIQPDDSDSIRVADVILQLMDSNLPMTLKSVPVVDAIATIGEEQLKSLWKCFDEDQVFNKHIPTILKSWALMLTQDNKLYSTSSYILPINHFYSSDKVIQDVYKVLKKLKMPFLNARIVVAHANCPTFTEGKRILSNLYFIRPLLPFLVKTDLDVIINYFRDYLKEDTFSGSEVIEHLQSLPLFENIDGSYTSIWEKNAYIWPADACPVAYQKWLEGYDAVFIKWNAKWALLGSAEKLSISAIYTEDMYVKFIFPHFNKMNRKERYQHLEHIKDYLYATYKQKSQISTDPTIYTPTEIVDQIVRATKFIRVLKELHCIEDDHLVLCPVSAFCDHTIDIFNAFSVSFLFLPEEYRDKKWLPFFRQLNLKCTVTEDNFIQFCHETASGDVAAVKSCSRILLQHLFKGNHKWRNNANFLHKVSEIAFVQQEHIPYLTWLVPSAYPVSQMVSLRGSAPVAQAPLVWTMKPVINILECSNEDLLDSLGIAFITDTDDVITMFVKGVSILMKISSKSTRKNLFVQRIISICLASCFKISHTLKSRCQMALLASSSVFHVSQFTTQ